MRDGAAWVRALGPSWPLLVLAFDAPLLGLGAVLPPAILRHLVLIPCSSAIVHAPSDHDRIAWEDTGMLVGASGGARIATLSRFMADHLHDAYDVLAMNSSIIVSGRPCSSTASADVGNSTRLTPGLPRTG